MKYIILSICLFFISACGNVREQKEYNPAEADFFIRSNMESDWKNLNVRKWKFKQIDEDGIKGYEILGTVWRANILKIQDIRFSQINEVEKYEFEGVALAQNYGVIDIYIYSTVKTP